MANTNTTGAQGAENRKPTYLELISKDEKTQKAESLMLKAQEAGLELSRAIFNLNTDIAAAKTRLAATQKAIPYSVAAEYKAVKDLEQLEARLEFAQAIKSERFSDATV